MASALAQATERNLLVVCTSLEEASRWAAQLEAMRWQTVQFYPTSEASPYEPFDPESEMIWGQLQVLAALNARLADSAEPSERPDRGNFAIVATERALQPHLPPPDALACVQLSAGMTYNSNTLERELAALGYARVPLVETEGTWSRRGDLVDIFPVSAELPVRLEWFGDELEKLREFDPATQRSLDRIETLTLTPTSFAPPIGQAILANPEREAAFRKYLTPEESDALTEGTFPEGMRRWLGLAFDRPASLLDYLPADVLCVDGRARAM